MPKGTKVISAEAYGHSAWTITGKITTILPPWDHEEIFHKGQTPFQSGHSRTSRRADQCMAIDKVPAKITAQARYLGNTPQ